jgi:RimJ/RimL family protein N-acetyltransferase
MPRVLPELPRRFETERLVLRCYEAGDGPWYYAMSQRNREHLSRYEAGNVALSIKSEEEAEVLVQELNAGWAARSCFFMGAFERGTGAFVAQIYVGPANRDLPEYSLGYFADIEHEGQGYVTEAARAALTFCFEKLGAHRVCLECDDTNVRSRRVAERCEMVLEGHVRENKRNADGSFSGTLYFGLLKREYETPGAGKPGVRSQGATG